MLILGVSSDTEAYTVSTYEERHRFSPS